MTHTELYEIVKDHADVWDKVLEFHNGHWADPDETNSWVPESIAEAALLGLGVEWLVENDKGLMILPKDNSGNYRVSAWSAACDSTPMLAAVYAAIAEVKKAKA